MKLRILVDTSVKDEAVKAGDVVEVADGDAATLLSFKLAEKVSEVAQSAGEEPSTEAETEEAPRRSRRKTQPTE